MNIIDKIINNPLRKNVDDLTVSDFIFVRDIAQYILCVQPRYAVKPVYKIIDEKDFDKRKIDMNEIKAEFNKQIDADIEETFRKIRGESFKEFFNRRLI